jgi:hypothetical protein
VLGLQLEEGQSRLESRGARGRLHCLLDSTSRRFRGLVIKPRQEGRCASMSSDLHKLKCRQKSTTIYNNFQIPDSESDGS